MRCRGAVWQAPCPVCLGHGAEEAHRHVCPACGGTGGFSAEAELGGCTHWHHDAHGAHDGHDGADADAYADADDAGSDGGGDPHAQPGVDTSAGPQDPAGNGSAPSSRDGWAPGTTCAARALPQTMRRTCRMCHGWGTIPDVPCPHCHVRPTALARAHIHTHAYTYTHKHTHTRVRTHTDSRTHDVSLRDAGVCGPFSRRASGTCTSWSCGT
jgi:hypothetical protein